MPLTHIYRLATVASGAASGKLLEYEVGGPRVSVQTAYGIEVEVGILGTSKYQSFCYQIQYLPPTLSEDSDFTFNIPVAGILLSGL